MKEAITNSYTYINFASSSQFWNFRSSHQRYSVKKGALKSFSKSTVKRLCQGPFLNKGTLAQLFSCEFCENFKNMLFTGHSKRQLLKVSRFILFQNLVLFFLFSMTSFSVKGGVVFLKKSWACFLMLMLSSV